MSPTAPPRLDRQKLRAMLEPVVERAGAELEDLTEQRAGSRRLIRVVVDRDGGVSPGVKFKDAELIGIPTIIVVGKGLVDGVVEVRDRASGERQDVPVAEAAARVRALAG